MLDRITRVKEIKDLGARKYLLRLNSPEQARLVRPGQFVMLKCAEELHENPLLRRPFSVFNIYRQVSSGRPAGLELLINAVGIGTRKLVSFRPGQMLYCLGPLGHGFQVTSDMRNRIEIACLLAGGVGIAPLYLLAGSLMALNIKPILFYGGSTAADLVLREYFQELGIETIFATEDGSFGERGLVTHPFEHFLRANFRKSIRVYACGPWNMMREVHRLCTEANIQCEVSLEARMGCGLGACLGCVVRTQDNQGEERYLRVCQEGPVINSRLIDWQTAPL